MSFHSRQLLAFMAVAEELHFGRAAQRLHVSQPPLSQQVRQFEEEAGVLLFERTTRSVRLTAAGQTLYEGLQRVVADSRAALDAARRVAAGEAGTLRLGFTSTAAYRLVPASAAPYRARYPEVHLAMEERTSNALLDGLLAGRLDLALMRKDEGAQHGKELHFEEVDREALVLALPPGHPLARRRQVPIALLEGVDFIGFAPATSLYFHTLLADLFLRNGVRPRVVMESVLPTLLALVESGIGAAIVPASVRRLRPDGVAYRPLAAPHGMPSVLYAVYRAPPANPAVQPFLAMVRAAGKMKTAGR